MLSLSEELIYSCFVHENEGFSLFYLSVAIFKVEKKSHYTFLQGVLKQILRAYSSRSSWEHCNSDPWVWRDEDKSWFHFFLWVSSGVSLAVSFLAYRVVKGIITHIRHVLVLKTEHLVILQTDSLSHKHRTFCRGHIREHFEFSYGVQGSKRENIFGQLRWKVLFSCSLWFSNWLRLFLLFCQVLPWYVPTPGLGVIAAQWPSNWKIFKRELD